VRLTAGGRVDLEVVAPARVEFGGVGVVIVGSPTQNTNQPEKLVDFLSYGTAAALPFDPDRADRRFRYSIGRRPGFVDGRPGLWWSINGHLFPDVPMFVVEEGDVVRMHISNHSAAVHPMHLHGHHAVVLARDGVKATGSPWWVDSLDVASGHSFDVAFLADNPGVWMDHCHNLPHASQGLVAHLMYAGLTDPFRVGGKADNQPE
jgi:FtsP/CotA-like multicopper oxidase with cupredoxin domain